MILQGDPNVPSNTLPPLNVLLSSPYVTLNNLNLLPSTLQPARIWHCQADTGRTVGSINLVGPGGAGFGNWFSKTISTELYHRRGRGRPRQR